ncbi:MAG: Type IV pilus assembly protein PilW [uncultured bacterium]|nr:MAG: Type IV pilus assembly protein PilW [uncultured bacterium]
MEASDDLVLVNNCPGGCPNAKPSLFDDRTYATDRYIPRAYRVGNNVGYNGSDYVVLKGTTLGTNKVSRAWGYLNYSAGTVVTPPRDASGATFHPGDRAIVLKSGMSAGREVRELVIAGNQFYTSYADAFQKEFRPKEPGDNFLVYGIDEPGGSLRFPFNRTDYYIDRPGDISRTCAPGTGVLYKSVINQSGKKPEECPILDCVADMQVVLYTDSNGDGVVDYHPDGEELDAQDALKTRKQLKEIRVYILAQQGRRDDTYRYPVAEPERAILVGDPALKENPEESALGRIWTSSKMADIFGSIWRNYRWKLYTIVVQPKNL